MRLWFFSLYLLITSLHSSIRDPLEDFISGDAFRSICQYVYEHDTIRYWEKVDESGNIVFNNDHFKKLEEKIIKNIKPGDCIFVQPNVFSSFFKDVHPKITQPYFLVSSFCDEPVFDETYLEFIEDPMIIKCFMKNININHKKVVPLPIGIENKANLYRKIVDLGLLSKIRDMNDVPRNKLMYMNFAISTFFRERDAVQRIFNRKSFVKLSPAVPFRDYLLELKRHIFCLSPAGNGVECHRTWEAMYMGCIPIICPMAKYPYRQPAKGYDELYHDLPVIVVKNWNEVTKGFLLGKLKEFKHRTFNMEKLYFPYWKNLIRSEVEAFKRDGV